MSDHERIAHSLIFFAKNKRFAQKTDERIPSPAVHAHATVSPNCHQICLDLLHCQCHEEEDGVRIQGNNEDMLKQFCKKRVSTMSSTTLTLTVK